ncbi:Required for meiotic nuclear division protein 1 homolog [Rhizoctonia solani AG-1 IB]|uniref:Required for meiotic nuclear division protein 1 homolog n=1 Tax=Thanatephorus cucumeris (strain AG1-IB / isolate 7/3/14) TaxID=1108050 RepID=M5BQ57_THACB|nr:Required for meiotic nuclear division protein 1 homolog [Rhizoctonia solani AG-1 IB]
MNIARLARSALRANHGLSKVSRPCLPTHVANYRPQKLPIRAIALTSQKLAQSPPPASPKSKPQTLRRAAQASLPIRSNPTPTRGTIRPVLTLATAESYNPHFLEGTLPPGSQRVHAAWWIPNWRSGEVWVFDSGSCVFWGLSEAEARMFVAEVIMRVKGVEVDKLKTLELEELEFVTDPKETTRLQGDLIILGQMPPISEVEFPSPPPSSNAMSPETLPARYAFSHSLARSSALAALETSLDSYLHSVSRLPSTLGTTGKPGLGRKELRMKLGQLMRFRQGVNLGRETFGDTPDLYWTEPVLEGYFDSVSEALEIKARADSVNAKITYAAELQGLLRELLAESSGHRMELIIIALIAVEVVIAIIRDGPELWHMVAGAPEANGEKNDPVQ